MQRDMACAIFRRLLDHYDLPESPRSFLKFENAFQILILTILSAQTTDQNVNNVRKLLFSKYPTPQALSNARQEDLEVIIKSCGFYRNKAKNIILTAEKIATEFGGEVPRTMEDLLTLPGVGRKTANIVLNHAFGINVGIAVDTHVKRLSWRLGFTESTNPVVIERDLMELFPSDAWGDINYLLIRHGRTICTSQSPRCVECFLQDLCRYYRTLET
jgi:endonuclease-3